MKGIAACLAIMLAVISAAYAASTVVPITIQPASSGGTTILPTPPNGFHWVQTFGDEFNTTFPNSGTSTGPVTLDTSHWQVEHSCGSANYTGYAPPTYGCGAAATASDTVSGGVLTMTIQSTAPATRNIIDTAYTAYPPGTNQPITPFQQRYGYFVYDAKLPTCSSNEFDLESFGGIGPYASGGPVGELGWVSQVNGGCNYRNLRAYQGSNGSFSFFADPDLGVDITAAFHQYGLLWTNDATAHGSVTVYFDGNAVTGPYALISPAFDSGIYFDVYWNPCVGCEGQTGTDPQGSTLQFNSIRAFQLASNTSGAINLVNKGVATASAAGTSQAVSIPSTAGGTNAEIIGVLWCNDSGCGTPSGDVISSVKVGAQSCTEVPGTFSSRPFDSSLVVIMLSVWECKNISAGQTTVTVTSSSSMWYIAGLASEWTCGPTNCSVDTGLGNTAATNSGTTLAIPTNGPTTVAGDLIYSFATGTGSGGIATGNMAINILSVNNLDAYQIAGAPGVYTMNWTESGTSPAISGVLAAFKP